MIGGMVCVGITGGIGSGKSFVADIWRALVPGVVCYDCDARAKVLMTQEAEVRARIIDIFGQHAYTDGGEVNRAFLAERIFGDASLRARLEAVVHPAVELDFRRWVSRLYSGDSCSSDLCRSSHFSGSSGSSGFSSSSDFSRFSDKSVPYVLKESAILYQSGADAGMDAVVAVCASDMVRVERAMQRDGSSVAQVEARIAAQMSQHEMVERGAWGLVNDKSQLLVPQLLALDTRIRNL